MTISTPGVAILDLALEMHPQVALRPEPFGALAYHYGNRRLVFMKHLDVLNVAKHLAEYATLADTLAACGINDMRWASFATAFESLQASEIVSERPVAG